MACHCPRNIENVSAQRETWAAAITASGYADVRFFFGRPPGKRYAGDDEIFLDVDDSYDGIPAKVQAIMGWAAEREYSHTMKADDDIYVCPERFPKLSLDGDYIGRFRAPFGVYPAYFASGFAYWLSLKAAKIVATAPWNGDWMDERFVANTLATRGIYGKHDDSNYFVTGPHTTPDNVPKRHIIRNGTVFCQYAAADIRRMHDLLCDSAAPARSAPLKDMPKVKVTAEMLMAKPKDSAAPEKRIYRG